MNDFRYIYIVFAPDDVCRKGRSKWIKFAFKTRAKAQQYIDKTHKKERLLTGGKATTELKIKQVCLYLRNDL